MYDYIVIGGGTAGSVMASRLTQEAGTSVCVLEAGPEADSALLRCPAGLALLPKLGKFNWSFESVPQTALHGRHCYQPRGKVLGGSSAINAMIYIRGLPADYDAWEAAGNPGWGWKDVLPYFMYSEANSRGADGWHGASGELAVSDPAHVNPLSIAFVKSAMQAGLARNGDFNGHTIEGAGLYQVMQRGGERFSAYRAYLSLYRKRPNLEVRTGTRVLRIITEERRAVGVEVLHNGRREELRCKREVLLCAGALQSPQILMLSGIGPGAHLQQHGIDVVADLPGVGQNLHDHPDVAVVHKLPGSSVGWGLSPAGIYRMAQGVMQWRRSRSGMCTSNLAEAGAFLRSQDSEPHPDLQLHFLPAQQVDHGRGNAWGHGYTCHVCVLQPLSRGSVQLASSDPLADPLIDPQYLSQPEDAERLLRGVRKVREILKQPQLAAFGGAESPDLAYVQGEQALEAWMRSHTESIYHPVGTCRMGKGAYDVVDHELRVHGVQGLRVVDASVMPRITSGNTQAPTVMIAERAAVMVRAAAQPEKTKVGTYLSKEAAAA